MDKRNFEYLARLLVRQLSSELRCSEEAAFRTLGARDLQQMVYDVKHHILPSCPGGLRTAKAKGGPIEDYVREWVENRGLLILAPNTHSAPSSRHHQRSPPTKGTSSSKERRPSATKAGSSRCPPKSPYLQPLDPNSGEVIEVDLTLPISVSTENEYFLIVESFSLSLDQNSF